MQPTLVIGLGGSGMKIGHALLYLFGRYMPKALLSPQNTSGSVKFLFIENDRTELDRVKKYLHDLKHLSDLPYYEWITGFHGKSVVDSLKIAEQTGKAVDDRYVGLLPWLDTKCVFPARPQTEGLSGHRQLGRMGTYFHNTTISNAIQRAVSELMSAAQKDMKGLAAGDICIHIIAGMTGGTGSSSFLDVATIVDNHLNLKKISCKNAFFIAPEYFLREKKHNQYGENTAEYKNLQINSWAFHSECEYFTRNFHTDARLLARCAAKTDTLEAKLNDGTYAFAPFTNAFLFDYKCSENLDIPRESFYETIANILFYGLFSASHAEFQSSFSVNRYEVADIQHLDYSSIGFKAIKFPRKEFTEYFRRRYLYDVFDKVLLKKDISEKILEDASSAFFRDNFSSQGHVFGLLEAKIDEELRDRIEIQQWNDLIRIERFEGKAPGVLAPYDQCQQIVQSDTDRIAEMRQALDTVVRGIEQNSLGFDRKYHERNTIADSLRRRLWEAVTPLILGQGYFACLGFQEGVREVRGFLARVYGSLCDEYQSLTAQLTTLEEQNPEEELSRYRDKLIEKAKGHFGKQKTEQIRIAFQAYAECLQRIYDRSLAILTLRLKQGILYEFAVGSTASVLAHSSYADTKKTPTDLDAYAEGLRVSVGVKNLGLQDLFSLLRWFDDNDPESKTSISARYNTYLPRDFRNADRDTFTTYIPEALSKYLDSSNRWKPETRLDNLYKENVKIDSSELVEMFRDNEQLLTRFGEDRAEINKKIEQIEQKALEYFDTKYLNPKTEIGRFLAQNVVRVFSSLPRPDKDRVRAAAKSLVYPVGITQSGSLRHIGPLANVKNRSDMESFVEELGIPKGNILENPEFEDNQIVLIELVEQIRFSDIDSHKLCKTLYDDRDIKVFRPHLNKEWNEFSDGVMNPRFAPKSAAAGGRTTVNIGGKDRNLSPLQMLQLCLLMDSLTSIDDNVRRSLFLVNAAKLKSFNALGKSPIHYDSKVKAYICYGKAGILDEGKSQKYALLDANDKKNWVVLHLNNKNVLFSDAISILETDHGFPEAFAEFARVLDTNLSLISKGLKRNRERLIKEILRFKTNLESLQRRNQRVTDQDVQYAADFAKQTYALAEEIFGEGII